MSVDWMFNLYVLMIFTATGLLLGFLWGNHRGVKKAQEPGSAAKWAHNSWQYLERK